MKDEIVAKCGEIAARADLITSFVFLWEEKDGMHYCRDGSLNSQLGMTEVIRMELKQTIKQMVKE